MASLDMSLISGVIWDLDGTVLDTESLIFQVAKEVVSRHGAELTESAAQAATGLRPLESWQVVADTMGLTVPAAQLLAESEELLCDRCGGSGWLPRFMKMPHGCHALLGSCLDHVYPGSADPRLRPSPCPPRWKEAKMLPGALRLLRHLQATGVPLALATSSNRANLTKKLSGHAHVHAAFQTTCCGDEVCVCGRVVLVWEPGGRGEDVLARVRRIGELQRSTPMPSDLENQRNSKHLRQTLSLLTT